jgi:hypothetical protein
MRNQPLTIKQNWMRLYVSPVFMSFFAIGFLFVAGLWTCVLMGVPHHPARYIVRTVIYWIAGLVAARRAWGFYEARRLSMEAEK